MFKESIRMSWSNIIYNKLRSFLTVLGIVIGVASIIALITIVQGATGEVTNQISALGANKITIQARGTPLKQGLSAADLQALGDIEYVRGVSPTVSGSTAVAANGVSKTGVTVQGKNEVHFQTDPEVVKNGRGLNILDMQGSTRVAVLGSKLTQDLFLGQNPIGRDMIINGHTFKVVGLLEESASFSFTSNNEAVIIPYTTAMKTLGTRSIMSVEVFMADSTRSSVIIDNISGVLNQAFNHKENAFTVLNMEDIISTIGNVTRMMTLLLAGIASISLVVGGIGIMNMMLVSVTERTAEIGLRKALGAEPSRIQLQFLIESIFLSIFGGIIGLLLGAAIAYVASRFIGFNFSLSVSTVILAAGFSAAVGVIFGFMPARKASQLNPIDALRHI